MMPRLILYTGETQLETPEIEARLREWCAERGDVEFLSISIHDDPAAAFRFSFSYLPALVIDGKAVAQGEAVDWLHEDFLADLARRIDLSNGSTPRGNPD